ncbi:MAG: glycosyltransferase [Acidimicrobiales bacterium]
MTQGHNGVTPVSVVVPAHNEEAVIGRCLTALFAGAEDGELDVVVVCNGCGDATAEVARQAAPQATVVEIPVASKVAALNAGDGVARYFPRFYVDADIEISVTAVRQVASVLRQGPVQCAAPRPFFDLEGRSWPIRAFYDVWKEVPYRALDLVGNGVYALSEQGRARFGEFPPITADDQFVQQQFQAAELRSVGEAHFVAHPPRRLRGLVAIRTRAYRGNRELAASGLARAEPPPSGARTVLRLARQPRRAPGVAVYAAVNLLARRRAARADGAGWERDESARGQPQAARRDEGQGGVGRRGVIYVMSRYPAVSHTFVMREVLALRASGTEVGTVSVRRAGPADLLGTADRQEAERTWDILPLDRKAFVRAHWRAASRHPVAYGRAMAEAVGSAPPGWRGSLWQLFYFAEAIYLWDHADAAQVRHLHAHLANVAADVCWLACSFGRLAQPGAGWAWTFTMHGPTELYSTERFNLARKVQRADAVICISEYTRSQLMYLSDPEHWGKLRVVHCGADLARYQYHPPPPPGGGLSVLCVARLAPQKGLDILVRAIGVLVEGGTDVHLTVVGAGPLEASLRRRAERAGVASRVSFAGAVGQDDMAGYYARADVFCLPSFAEGLPVVLMEAMATGRPVVATRIMGVPELVEEGVSGFLVAPGSVDELAGALRQLAVSPDLRQSFGRAGRLKVEKSFDAVRCAGQVAEVFDEMTSYGRGRAGGKDKEVEDVPVTVVVPTFRRPDRLEQALGSVFSQRGVRAREVIVVDDGSQDGTAELARSLGARVIEKAENEGLAAARDDGVRAAEGAEWVALLDDDDRWLPHHLETLWSRRDGHVLVAGTSLNVGDDRPRHHGAPTGAPEVVRSPARLVFPENSFTASATMVRRDILLEVGSFDRKLRYVEDLDAWIRVLERGTGVLLPDVTCLYAVHPGQMSKDRGSMLAASERVLDKYSGRPWLTPALRERLVVVDRWDDLQMARAARHWAEVWQNGRWLVSRPARAVALTKLWAFRRRVRHRPLPALDGGAALTGPGRPSTTN